MIVQVHTLRADTTAEGPGHRFCVWVQGCERRCPGCFARSTWDRASGTPVTVDDLQALLERRLAQTQEPPLEGITLLGGEPFLQAAALARFASHARERGLGVLCFTGYTYEELLEDGPEGAGELLAVTDVLVDGPYLAHERDLSRPLAGSRNQRFHFLTSRYNETAFLSARNRVEVRLHRDGSLAVNGMADFFDATGTSIP